MRHFVLAALAFGLTLPAFAHDHCPAPGRHVKFGEQRAYFQDVLGACRTDGTCSVVVATRARDGAAFAQQMRIARPKPGDAYQVDFAAASPMAAGLSRVDLRFGAATMSAPTTAIAGNEFRVANAADADKITQAARTTRLIRWSYPTADKGLAAAEFSMRGMNAALAWIECMGGQTQAAAPPKELAPLGFTLKANDKATAKAFQADLRRRYGGMKDAAAIAADMQYQGLDCTPTQGVYECQRVRQIEGSMPCVDVWTASISASAMPMVKGDYARRCMGALPAAPQR